MALAIGQKRNETTRALTIAIAFEVESKENEAIYRLKFPFALILCNDGKRCMTFSLILLTQVDFCLRSMKWS